jgi:ERCC4-type nuclease
MSVILVDDRTGSKELAPLIQELSVPVGVTRLESGDFQFLGNGPHGQILVGIERKTLPDLISCMFDHRYAGSQLPKFVGMYQSKWLYVESPPFRPDAEGMIEVSWRGTFQRPYGTKPVMFRQVDNFLNSSQMLHGVLVKRTFDMRDTARHLVNLYWWWQKEWEEHKSHKTIYTPASHVAAGNGKVSLCRQWANAIPGIGWEKSAAVEAHFGGNALRMATATRDEWMIPKVVGEKMSLKIVQLIRAGTKMTPEERELLISMVRKGIQPNAEE